MDKVDFLYLMFNEGKLEQKDIFPCNFYKCDECPDIIKNPCYFIYGDTRPVAYERDYKTLFEKYPEVRIIL